MNVTYYFENDVEFVGAVDDAAAAPTMYYSENDVDDDTTGWAPVRQCTIPKTMWNTTTSWNPPQKLKKLFFKKNRPLLEILPEN